jgi:hypothetical protein
VPVNGLFGLAQMAEPEPGVPAEITRTAVKGRSNGVDHEPMQMARYLAVTTNNWVDLRVAAEYSDVPFNVLVDAVTDRKIRSITSHPERPGDWLVPLAEVELWWSTCRLGATMRADH